MVANNIQIGGNHYKLSYQHWDFIIDTNIHYILANAIKYIVRWRRKDGVNDLKKAKHYLDKAIECNIIIDPGIDFESIDKFTDQLPVKDAIVILHICGNQFSNAVSDINKMINRSEKGLT